jgi:curved DNA-binding protein CbpA
MKAERSHYETLGVSPTATADQIRRAYRELAKQHHPDTGAKGSEKKFATIAAAYEVLAEPSKRREYDRALEQQRAEAAGSGGSCAHYSWESIAGQRKGSGERVDVSEFDELYDTFYGKHVRREDGAS